MVVLYISILFVGTQKNPILIKTGNLYSPHIRENKSLLLFVVFGSFLCRPKSGARGL